MAAQARSTCDRPAIRAIFILSMVPIRRRLLVWGRYLILMGKVTAKDWVLRECLCFVYLRSREVEGDVYRQREKGRPMSNEVTKGCEAG